MTSPDQITEAVERLGRDLEIQDGGGIAYTALDCGLYPVIVQGEDLRALLHSHARQAEEIGRLTVARDEARAELSWPWQFPPIEMAGADVLAIQKWNEDGPSSEDLAETVSSLLLNLGHIRRAMKAAEARVSVLEEALSEAERFMAYFADQAQTFAGPGTPKTCLATIRAALTQQQSDGGGMHEELIRHMVDRFLMWRLPENFNPDGGISFKAEFNEHTAHPMKHQPSGTNLFDATQATAMVRHMVEGLPLAALKAVAGEGGMGSSRDHAHAVGVALERAAQICEEQARAFLSEQYATGQPGSSFNERFACNECAREIRTEARLSSATGSGAPAEHRDAPKPCSAAATKAQSPAGKGRG